MVNVAVQGAAGKPGMVFENSDIRAMVTSLGS
jgi:hypothetical protein